ncbi:hypothetical protein [Streptomyces sp. NPDC005302]|uniref:hypothetical protein n=1 Tax=Streptomyces sp. NPDC005302 TaxID=3154675 RepID=UPI0033A49867
MNKFLAGAVHALWAAQYDREPDMGVVQSYHTYVALMCPHTVAPMVPETLRGPKWGKR